MLAKIDATEAKAIAAKHGIRAYPTLKFFRSGSGKNYDGKRTTQDIIDWLHVNAVPLVTLIENRLEVLRIPHILA